MSEKIDREIVEAATQGPWGASVITETDGKWYFVLDKNRMVMGDADKENDAQYIAHFNPSKVAEMLDEIAQLKAENERLKDATQHYESMVLPEERQASNLLNKIAKLKAERDELKQDYDNLYIKNCNAQTQLLHIKNGTHPFQIKLKAERDEARTKLNWIDNLAPWYHPQTGELYYHEEDVKHVLNWQPKEQGQ